MHMFLLLIIALNSFLVYKNYLKASFLDPNSQDTNNQAFKKEIGLEEYVEDGDESKEEKNGLNCFSDEENHQ